MFRLRPSVFRPILNSSKAAWVGGAIAGAGFSLANLKRPILLDTYAPPPPRQATVIPEIEYPQQRRILYQQLSVGSFAGLLCGLVLGKMSKLLVYVAAAGFLTIHWLQNRGLMPETHTLPVIGDFIVTLRHRLNARQLVTEKPAFKVSFLSSFVVAAMYA